MMDNPRSTEMTFVAQTNLQLYRQLVDQGLAPSNLAAVHRAYDLAASLFAGVYRASGKPFVAHLVGTASLLAAQGAPSRLVTAGLLHSAYLMGSFGDGPPGRTPRRQERLVEAVGGEVEALVSRYATFPWKGAHARGAGQWPASLGPLDREVLTLRLANELEELIDFDVLYSEDAERRRDEALDGLPVWTAWARGLSAERLALALEAVGLEMNARRQPEELRTNRVRSYRPLPVSPPTIVARGRMALFEIRAAVRRLGAALGGGRIRTWIRPVARPNPPRTDA
jgi:hypothetical protein